MLVHLMITIAALFGFFHAVFFIAWWRQDNSIADVAWGLGFIVVTLASLLQVGSFEARQLLVLILVTVWGVRLAGHIFVRNHGRGEDARYAAWRKDWGENQLLNSYVRVFVLQACLLLIVAAPLHVIQLQGEQPGLGWLDWFGAGIFLFGLMFESVSDAQLLAYKKEKSQAPVLQTGLWRFSRHPNYFGEITLWWGMGVIALSVPWGWLALIGPVTITFLITKVSGIPLLEQRFAKDAAYQEYAKKTSILIPFLPIEK